MLLKWQTDEAAEKGEMAGNRDAHVQQTRQAVSEAIVREQVPPGYHGSIQKYFDSLAADNPHEGIRSAVNRTLARRLLIFVLPAAVILAAATFLQRDRGGLVVACTHDAEFSAMVFDAFTKATGIPVTPMYSTRGHQVAGAGRAHPARKRTSNRGRALEQRAARHPGIGAARPARPVFG